MREGVQGSIVSTKIPCSEPAKISRECKYMLVPNHSFPEAHLGLETKNDKAIKETECSPG